MQTKAFLAFIFFPFILLAQDDLLNELEQETVVDKTVTAAFKGLKVVNFESTKIAAKNDFYFIVSHRFGTVKNGVDDLFGLDQSVTQIKFIYGFLEWLNLGVSRSSNQKKYGFQAKYRIKKQQTDGFPVTVVGYNLITINTSLRKDYFPNIVFGDKLTYTTQLLLSRKFSEKLSLLLAPTFLHQNVATRSFIIQDDNTTLAFDEDNSQFAVGLGGRYKISKRVSINADYGVHLNRNSNSNFKNPLSIGVDIETGGHVFQLNFSNAQAMVEEGFIVNAQGDWGSGDFFFGFNLQRVF